MLFCWGWSSHGVHFHDGVLLSVLSEWCLAFAMSNHSGHSSLWPLFGFHVIMVFVLVPLFWRFELLVVGVVSCLLYCVASYSEFVV